MAGRYGYIFQFLVKQLNRYTSPVSGPNTAHYIAFLDIFGFETMGTNSLEQLCINYANEKLQQQFNNATFTSEIKVYDDEELPTPLLTDLKRCVIHASRLVMRCERARVG
jgi:myosin heavy subunit